MGLCVYPECNGPENEPRPTAHGMCRGCRRRYAVVIDRLALHYPTIRATLPVPISTRNTVPSRVKVDQFGHPREWASDMCREIVTLLMITSMRLAVVLEHPCPVQRKSAEPQRAAQAYHYLSMWHAELCAMPDSASYAEALIDLDKRMLRGLGATEVKVLLPVPCSNPECGLLTLVKSVEHVGSIDLGVVECQVCGLRLAEDEYKAYTRGLVDDIAAVLGVEETESDDE